MLKEISVKDFIGYVLSQFLGALFGIEILYFILLNSNLGTGNLGINGFGTYSMLDINLIMALFVEIIMSFVFIYTVLVMSKDNNSKIAGLVIGLCLMLMHLFGINLTGTSLNPARSLAPAIIVGGEALKQAWLFIVSPLIGSWLATVLYKILNN